MKEEMTHHHPADEQHCPPAEPAHVSEKLGPQRPLLDMDTCWEETRCTRQGRRRARKGKVSMVAVGWKDGKVRSCGEAEGELTGTSGCFGLTIGCKVCSEMLGGEAGNAVVFHRHLRLVWRRVLLISYSCS
jgi:hypothetical protein